MNQTEVTLTDFALLLGSAIIQSSIIVGLDLNWDYLLN